MQKSHVTYSLVWKKDFRRAKVCKYIQKNLLKQIKMNVYMQIYANLCK